MPLCLGCGKEFAKLDKNQACSDYCLSALFPLPGVFVEVRLGEDGKLRIEFPPLKWRKTIPKKCVGCGREFLTDHNAARYCSQACPYESGHRNRRPNNRK